MQLDSSVSIRVRRGDRFRDEGEEAAACRLLLRQMKICQRQSVAAEIRMRFSSACENFVICLNTFNYACAICWRFSRVPGRDGRGRSQGWRGGRAVLRRRRGKRRNPIERVRAPVSDVIEIIIKRERATMSSSLLQLPFAIPLSLFSFSFFLFFPNRVRGIMGWRRTKLRKINRVINAEKFFVWSE